MFGWLDWPIAAGGEGAVPMSLFEMGLAITALAGLWYLHREALNKLRDSQAEAQRAVKELAELFSDEKRELAASFRDSLAEVNRGWKSVVDQLLAARHEEAVG